MAIKVGGTEVIDNSRELKNISSVDSTTTSTLDSTLNPNPNRGTLTKTFSNNEEATITLNSAVSTAPVVTVTKEVAQTGLSNGDWDVATTGSNYDIEDFAYSANVTVDNSAKTLTLSTGSWGSGDVGKRVVGNSGEVVIISVASSVATYDDSTGTNFPNNNTLTSGNWNLFSLDFAATGVTFSEGEKLGDLVAAKNYYFNNKPIHKGSTNLATITSVTNPSPNGIAFNNDGTKIYFSSYYPNSYIYELNLSTAYDPTTATYNNVYLDVSSQDSTPGKIQFKPDGTKMFIFGEASDYIYQYSLSTAYDLSTASYDSVSKSLGALTQTFLIKSDGLKMLLGERLNSSVTRLEEWEFSTAFDVSTLSNTGRYEEYQTDLSNGNIMCMALDPTDSMLTIMDANDNFYTFTLGRYWNQSTGPRTLDGSAFNTSYVENSMKGFVYSGDGHRLIAVGIQHDNIQEFYTPAPHSVINGAPPLPYKAFTIYGRHSDFDTGNQAYGIEINNDGTKIYAVSSQGDRIYEFDLSTAYDIQTLSYSGVKYTTTSDGATNPVGMTFNNNGTKMYVVCNLTDTIYQYSLSTAYDLSTVSYDSVSLNVSTQEAAPNSVQFNSDGTKMFVLGSSGDAVDQWSLTTAFDISTASYDSVTFSVSAQDSTPFGLKFSPDGTKMFHGGLSSGFYWAYSLSTAYDITTASLIDKMDFPPDLSPTSPVFNNDGTKMFSASGQRTHILEFELPNAYQISRYNNTVVDLSSNTGTGIGIEFKTDGTKFYMLDYSQDRLEQYSLSTAYDLSTLSYENKTLYFGSQETLPFGFTFKPDGTKVYMIGPGSDTVYQYSLSTAWDISTGSYDSVSFSVATEEGTPYDIKLNSDGTKMYILGDSGNGIDQYSLSTAYDVSTASYDSVHFSVNTQDASPRGFNFSSDGTRLFVVGSGNDALYPYSLSTAFDVSTASFDGPNYLANVLDAAGFYSMAWNSDGSKAYLLGANATERVYEYSTTFGKKQPLVAVVPLSQYAGAVTNASGQIDSKYWADINSMTASETLNSANIYYAIATDGSTFKVNHNTNGLRSIVKNNSGTWQYNSNATYASETWVNATRNSVHGALENAMSVAANQMDSTQLQAVSDANHYPLALTLDLAIILYTTDVDNNPISDGIDINYDANALNQGAVVGTDYNFDFPDSTTVRVTSLAAQNLKIRVV